MTIPQQPEEILNKVRKEKPLVHNMTNLVVTNVTANATLAAGASPVMAHAEEEVADMVQAAGALVLNIGTLDESLISAMIVAGKRANQLNIPVLLDPVGAGATPMRTQSIKRIMEDVDVAILRGNVSEIRIVGGQGGPIKGVDAVSGTEPSPDLARQVAQQYDCVVAVTGEVDQVSDGQQSWSIHNGHPQMSLVTGSGCMSTAIMGAWAAVATDLLSAAAGSLAYFGLAGEAAAQTARGPGSFQVALLDELHGMTSSQLRAGIRIQPTSS